MKHIPFPIRLLLTSILWGGLVLSSSAATPTSTPKLGKTPTRPSHRLLTEVLALSDQQLQDLFDKIGEDDCDIFMGAVLQDESSGSDLTYPKNGLNLKWKGPLQKKLAQLKGVKADNVWEGLREIDLLRKKVHGLKDRINDLTGQQYALYRGGNPNESPEERKRNTEHKQTRFSDLDSDKRKIYDQITELFDQMESIAALALSRVPVEQRIAVLQTLKDLQ